MKRRLRPLPPEPQPSFRINAWLIVILLGLTGVMIYRQTFWYSSLFNPNAKPRTVTPRGDLAADENATIELFSELSPSVVHITSVAQLQHRFTLDVETLKAGSGSGIIWDTRGHIVTNLHVIENAQDAMVTLYDNTNHAARLVGFDAAHDLAVLKIRAPAGKLAPIAVGESANLQVGQKVFAIGSPYEFDLTLTTGVISGLNRSVPTTSNRRIYGAIQTDAAINPGNSGGPLLDSAGRLIGVNTAIYSESGGSHGIGFAIPVDVVNVIVPDLIQDGQISRPWMGVIVRESVIIGGRRLPGVLVQQVYPGGPADVAGILPIRRGDQFGVLLGDQIIAINKDEVDSVRDLLALVSKYRAGDTIDVTIIRNGRTLKITAKLQDRPTEEQMNELESSSDQ